MPRAPRRASRSRPTKRCSKTDHLDARDGRAILPSRVESSSRQAQPPFPHAKLVLTASGVSGFLIGLSFWDWQWAVEHAQVTAGLVSYSPASPPGIAHAKLWSIVPQLGAALLRMGVSETTLSQLLSGVLGWLSFQALAAVSYAVGRSAFVALGAAFVVFVSHATDYGVVYPIILLGSGHTYGSAGLSFVALAIGLLGMGWYRTGSFLLAVSPAVHPALGLWALTITTIAVVTCRRDVLVALADTRSSARVLARYVAAGGAMTVLSFAWHRMQTAPYCRLIRRRLMVSFRRSSPSGTRTATPYRFSTRASCSQSRPVSWESLRWHVWAGDLPRQLACCCASSPPEHSGASSLRSGRSSHRRGCRTGWSR